MPKIDPAGVVQTPRIVAELEALLKRALALISAALLSVSATKAAPELAAPADVHGIVAGVKALVDDLDRRAEERNAELSAHIKALERKVDKSKGRHGKRECTYSFEARAIVPIIWEEANGNEPLKSTLTTRMKFEAAFNYYKNRLLPVGIESWERFKGCVRSTREIARRDAKLAAAAKPAPPPKPVSKPEPATTPDVQEKPENGIIEAVKPSVRTAETTHQAAAQAPNTVCASKTVLSDLQSTEKNGIISAMTSRISNVIATRSAIANGKAACAASGASVLVSPTPPPLIAAA